MCKAHQQMEFRWNAPLTVERLGIDPGLPGFQMMKAMLKHRSHSVEFKRQITQEFIAGETLHALTKRHDVSRNLIRIWVKKLEAGAFDEDARAADSPSGLRGKDRSARTHGRSAGAGNE
jgi:transposase-like protein